VFFLVGGHHFDPFSPFEWAELAQLSQGLFTGNMVATVPLEYQQTWVE
jgi:hypothetical protein